MSRALALIDEVLARGSITEREHDRIMELIHKDGQIDQDESEKLSVLFNAIKSGNLVFSSENKKATEEPSSLHSLKAEALQRDVERSSKSDTHGQKNTKEEAQESHDHTQTSFSTNTTLHSQDLSTQNQYTDDTFSHLFGLEEHRIVPRSEVFHKVTERMLEAQLNGRLWMKTGAMIAYQGAMKFRREGITEHGLGKLIKRGLTGESTPLTAAEGKGALFLADQGKKICLVDLKGVPIYVQSQHILAFEDTVNWDVQPLFNIGTALAGGLFHISFSGRGKIAFTSEFDPVVLRVSPGSSIMTDAAATVGWSSGVVPSVRTDINIQTLIGRGSGETLQLRFEGDGVVIVQPFETSFKKEE